MSTDSIHFLINIDGNSNRTHGIENVTQRAPFPAITYPQQYLLIFQRGIQF